ncbi:hypothetical protein [Sphaerisporangium sp. NPDC051011]|uniref:hypothetical protein n=1 Tax=Sphaerisporangium sp. NPDC051011 TaxID=3155792 RepID=UPI0033ECB675
MNRARSRGRVLTGSPEPLDGCSRTCLQRVWRAQHFSWWMTTLLHTFNADDADGCSCPTSST